MPPPKTNQLNKRTSGVLLPISSLDGPFGVGDFGNKVYRFVEFLKNAEQRYWQLLPLNPIGLGHSPYSTICSFAGEALYIDVMAFVKDELLKESDISIPDTHFCQTSYSMAFELKWPLFNKAFQNFLAAKKHKSDEFLNFVQQQSYWLNDYSLFCVLADKFKTRYWANWPEEYKCRNQAALDKISSESNEEILLSQFLQFYFFKQWHSIKSHCHKNHISLIGDIPIFVSYQSSDVWAHQEIFWLDENKRPSFVAGVPPDPFFKSGQLWGNALYDWQKLKANGYQWWLERIKLLFNLFDIVRLDHFIGFCRYWQIPSSAKTAAEGQWIKVDGADFFASLKIKLGKLAFIAEDLGAVGEDVFQLRDQFGLPGMRILQFGYYKNDDSAYHLPTNYPKQSVAYTGTHDMPTIRQWFDEIKANPDGIDMKMLKKHLLHYSKLEEHWQLIALCMDSNSNLTVIPMQDVLGFGAAARMNIPATTSGNWLWRLNSNDLNDKVMNTLAELTKKTDRVN